MFARFRNLFSKNKNDTEVDNDADANSEVGTSVASSSYEVIDSGSDNSKLEGLNLLKSLVETESKLSNNETITASLISEKKSNENCLPTLSQEVAEMFRDKVSDDNETLSMASQEKSNENGLPTLSQEVAEVFIDKVSHDIENAEAIKDVNSFVEKFNNSFKKLQNASNKKRVSFDVPEDNSDEDSPAHQQEVSAIKNDFKEKSEFKETFLNQQEVAPIQNDLEETGSSINNSEQKKTFQNQQADSSFETSVKSPTEEALEILKRFNEVNQSLKNSLETEGINEVNLVETELKENFENFESTDIDTNQDEIFNNQNDVEELPEELKLNPAHFDMEESTDIDTNQDAISNNQNDVEELPEELKLNPAQFDMEDSFEVSKKQSETSEDLNKDQFQSNLEDTSKISKLTYDSKETSEDNETEIPDTVEETKKQQTKETYQSTDLSNKDENEIISVESPTKKTLEIMEPLTQVKEVFKNSQETESVNEVLLDETKLEENCKAFESTEISNKQNDEEEYPEELKLNPTQFDMDDSFEISKAQLETSEVSNEILKLINENKETSNDNDKEVTDTVIEENKELQLETKVLESTNQTEISTSPSNGDDTSENSKLTYENKETSKETLTEDNNEILETSLDLSDTVENNSESLSNETELSNLLKNPSKESEFSESSITTTNSNSVNDMLQEIITAAAKIDSDEEQQKIEPLSESVSEPLSESPSDSTISKSNSYNLHEDSSEFSESSQSLSSIKENHAYSTSLYPSTDSETNLYTNSSIVVEDLPSEVNTPSPTVESTISGSSSSNTSTLDSSVLNECTDPSKIIVKPINNNILACNAITTKLTDIAEVAESLDTVIRNIQENSQAAEIESNPSPSDKKLGTLRSTSSEDWHSRSTEDDSFATASEGNFTPHSHSSSSFQTASGRTSSYISCDKNSFDASEADDSTFAFDMPELTSPLNMSFEGSEQSYISAQHLDDGGDQTPQQDQQQTPTKLSESGGSQTLNFHEEDQSSIADIDELHSESVTPTPQDQYEYLVDSIPIESETELEVAGISDAPSMEILTETRTMPMSRTPEVSSPSSSSATAASLTPLNPLNVDNDPTNSNEQNTNKPNAAWRRSKYYENITKQTIKGFL